MNTRRLLVQVTMLQLTGEKEAGVSDTKAALSLWVQGQKFTDRHGSQWEVKTIMHLPGEEALGRRAVCAEEGHRIPEKPRGSLFGCQRCDMVFSAS
jgi:hypothetical protein